SGSTGQAQGSVHLAAGASRSCTLVYAWPSDIGEDQRATVFIHNSDDFIEGNDQATAVSRLARLRVNRTHDAGERVPGDGDCDASNTGAGDCTLRAAIMEANALPGRQVVELPWSASSYAITSISGDDDQLKGDLDLHGAITLLGEPHASGPRPVIALMLPPAQRDRAIDSDGTVRIEQVEIRGQGLAIAEDGGLLRARGNALILRDVLLRDGATLGSGGAVHAESRLTLERVQVLDSQAARGGGLAFVPDGMPIADITDALFEGN